VCSLRVGTDSGVLAGRFWAPDRCVCIYIYIYIISLSLSLSLYIYIYSLSLYIYIYIYMSTYKNKTGGNPCISMQEMKWSKVMCDRVSVTEPNDFEQFL